MDKPVVAAGQLDRLREQACIHKCLCVSLPQTCLFICSASLSYLIVANQSRQLCCLSCPGHRAVEQMSGTLEKSSISDFCFYIPVRLQLLARTQPQVCMCLQACIHVTLRVHSESCMLSYTQRGYQRQLETCSIHQHVHGCIPCH